MAYVRVLNGPRRVLIVLLAAVTVVVGTAVSARADPSIPQIESQINRSWNTLEPVVEQYNMVHGELQQNQAKSAALERQIRPLQLQVDVARTGVGVLASSVYEGGPVFGVGAIISSSSPGTLADQLVVLDEIARRRAATVQGAANLVAKYAAEKQRLDNLVATQSQQDKQLAAKKAIIQGQVNKLQKLRQQAFGSSGAARAAIQPVACPFELGGGRGANAARAACDQIGKPYKWAAAGPSSFDCSGITMFAWAAAGVHLGHYTKWQWEETKPITRAQLQPGDLVFYFTDVHHMSIYVGGGWVVHAPETGDVVRMMKLDNPYLPIEGYRRPA